MRAPGSGLISYLLSILLILALWEAAVRALHVPAYVVPPPSLVLERVGAEFTSTLLPNAVLTTVSSLLGFGIAIVVGVGLAVVISYSRVADRFLYPIMVASQVIPKVAVAPLLVIWLGFGLTPKVFDAFVLSFFVIAVDTTVGLKNLDVNMLHLSRSMGASPLMTFLKIRLPNALPNFFAALKVGVTLAVVGAVVGEFVGSSSGLGYVLVTAMGNVNTPLAFASITMMAAVGLLLFLLVELVERLAIPWQRSVRLDEATARSALKA
jgi:NitT/TauT family transport system permease protein